VHDRSSNEGLRRRGGTASAHGRHRSRGIFFTEMSTFKRYLMFQAMMFVFGIVGPIFLIMFFTVQPDPTVKCAYWWGLFITAADVLIALWLTAASGVDGKGPKDTRIAAELDRRMQGGDEVEVAS
jgi:hypothetical protein